MDFNNLPPGTVVTVFTPYLGHLTGEILAKKEAIAPFNFVYVLKILKNTMTIWVYPHQIVKVEDNYNAAWDRAMRGI